MHWIKIDDINKLELTENTQFLVCVEKWNGNGFVWHNMVANWYKEGSELTLREDNNTPHYHKITNTGFYVIHDCGEDRYKRIYEISHPSYYSEISYPGVSPDFDITIEK